MCSGDFDLAFAVDTAALSPSDESCAERKRFMSEAVSVLNIAADRTRVALVTFGSDTEVVVDLKSIFSTHPVLLRYKMFSITCQGLARNLAGGLKVLITDVFNPVNGDRELNTNVLLLLVTASFADDRSIEYAAVLKQRGVRIIAVALDSRVRRVELESIASSSLDVVYLDDFVDLESRLDQLTQLLCKGKQRVLIFI